MEISETLKDALIRLSDISLGYSEIHFFSVDDLDKEQVGYRVDTKGKSLLGNNARDWQETWVVIGIDGMLGDPIFIDISTQSIMTAMHGEGIWEPVRIADSIDTFSQIIEDLKKLSINRETPVAIEKQPISNEESEQLLNRIRIANRKAEMSYWESFLENV